MELDFDNIIYSNRFVECEIPFKFSDAGVSTLCLKIEDLPSKMEPEFILKVGVCIEDLSIEDLYKMILICGPKTDLKIDSPEDKFIAKVMLSQNYAKDLKLNYTEKTETNVSKLYRACIKDHQGKLVAFLLRNNPTLFNLQLTEQSDNDESKYDAITYAKFPNENYLQQIWDAFGEPKVNQSNLEFT